MQPKNPLISIVIPCRNERHYIAACVRSILAQELPPEGVEIIVADGMSDDGTRDILARLASENPCLQLIDNPERIISTGLNAAIKMARGRVIIRMDAHTEYAADYVLQCLRVLRETRAENVGGPWIAKGEGYAGQAIAAAFQSAFAIGGARGHQPDYEGPVDTVYLGAWPRAVFERIGFFDEELVRSEDDEFNLRLTRAGGKIWQSPQIRSWYRCRGSLPTLFRQYKYDGYWKVRVIQKHRMPASVRHLIPGSFVFAIVALPLLALYWPPAVWAWIGLIGLYGLCNVGASVLTAARQGLRYLPLFPLVFACYHLAYGYGFLRGIWDFVIRRRGPHRTYTQLTRTAAKPVP